MRVFVALRTFLFSWKIAPRSKSAEFAARERESPPRVIYCRYRASEPPLPVAKMEEVATAAPLPFFFLSFVPVLGRPPRDFAGSPSRATTAQPLAMN